jgi:hypothetical protein
MRLRQKVEEMLREPGAPAVGEPRTKGLCRALRADEIRDRHSADNARRVHGSGRQPVSGCRLADCTHHCRFLGQWHRVRPSGSGRRRACEARRLYRDRRSKRRQRSPRTRAGFAWRARPVFHLRSTARPFIGPDYSGPRRSACASRPCSTMSTTKAPCELSS